MVWLKYYQTENDEFPEENKRMISSQRDVQIIVNKLTRHFGMQSVDVVFTKLHSNTGTMNHETRVMKLHKDSFSFLIVCHELAHQWLYDRTGKHGHTKKLATLVRRLVRYCRKKNFWDADTQVLNNTIVLVC